MFILIVLYGKVCFPELILINYYRMKKRALLIGVLTLSLFTTQAEEVKVKEYLYVGPITVNKPVLSDTLDVNGKSFEVKKLLKTSLPFEKALSSAHILSADTSGTVTLGQPESEYALHLLSFYLNSDRYAKGTLDVTGSGEFEVYVDGKSVSSSSELVLEPRRYQVVVKYLTAKADTCPPTLKAMYKSSEKALVTASLQADKRYTLPDMIGGKDLRGAQVSPNGKYALVRYVNRLEGGKSESFARLLDVATNRVLLQDNGFLKDARWMPQSNRFYYTRTGLRGTELVTVDPTTMQENVLVMELPKGSFEMAPDESYLIFRIEEEGPKEGKELIRVLEPGDRIPGFRNRSFLWRYDLNSGLFEQLTFGHKSTYMSDISQDSRYLLFSTSERVYTSLPHSRSSLYRLDMQTMAVDTVWEEAAYRSTAVFSPDAKQLLVFGSGNSFDNIGLNINEDQIANSYDNQLFLYDLATGKAKALTKDFNPNITTAIWSKHDNLIYILSEDEDYQRIYTCNPVSGDMRRLDLAEDVVLSFSLAKNAPVMYYFGQSISNANRLYVYDLKGKKNRLVDDLSAERLKDIVLGEAYDWDFTSAEGTTIQGRYYLPPNFDASKKYPMIVYYYGGTSPTNRALEQRYSMHLYAAMGYVVYTLNPSGTTGFGQEFAARHVNAWGKVTADEIILGTEQFCKEHNFVDKTKIGCIGASYGGFMTQYLQTQTDLFAAAVSHAGISALSSYWGEGFWGYGYCSIANAGTYPWNDPAFFTEQSPLFQADKINTPLLLLHGNVDTNVPIGESVQMFAALKILGKEVEFVQVEGENHGIVEYNKRMGWQNSIFAWFAKWLKEEPEWWEAMYPERTL